VRFARPKSTARYEKFRIGLTILEANLDSTEPEDSGDDDDDNEQSALLLDCIKNIKQTCAEYENLLEMIRTSKVRGYY
jgi:hypothetical protein